MLQKDERKSGVAPGRPDGDVKAKELSEIMSMPSFYTLKPRNTIKLFIKS